MSEILDDMDSRPGSTTSLLRTVVGTYLRALGGWISVADLLELMSALEVPAPVTRTAVARVKKRDLLIPETRDRVAGYRIADDAVPMLDRGDRRIYHPRRMPDGGEWCLVSFSIPEESRSLRHQLRRRLHWIGCGTVSPALWIAPGYLLAEVIEILDAVGVRSRSTVFVTRTPILDRPLADAVAEWWDLDEVRGHHEEFIAAFEHEHGVAASTDPRTAFARYIRSVDAWRVIPYIDPGLPTSLLPADWPGGRSDELVALLRTRYSALAAVFVAEVTGVPIADPVAGATMWVETS